MFSTCCDDPENMPKELFFDALNEGQFAIILDGLDEVRIQQRRTLESSLIDLFNTDNLIIVSSRPSAALIASQKIGIFNIEDLDLDQGTRIVEYIDFDQDVKDKFVQALQGGMFEQHKSFASRPLLLTLMLLTFNLYADVPNKMHLFYDQAFDVLFSRHDALKEVFRREKLCKLQIDTFKNAFSVFCLLTYNDAKFEFSESEMLEYIKKAAKICGEKFEPSDFLNDLLDSVNVMHREGLKFVFSHRSFQEYFTAYSILRLDETKAQAIIAKISDRSRDSVLPMLYDMNINFFQRLFLDPYLEDYLEKTSYKGRFSISNYLKSTKSTLLISPILRSDEPSDHGSVNGETEILRNAVVFVIDGGNAAMQARSFVGKNVLDVLTTDDVPSEIIQLDLYMDREIGDGVKELLNSFGVQELEQKYVTMFFNGVELQILTFDRDGSKDYKKVINLEVDRKFGSQFRKFVDGTKFSRMIGLKRKFVAQEHKTIKRQISSNSKSIDGIIGL